MNSTTGYTGLLGSNNIGGFGYGIGVSIGILLLITTITLASYFCARNQQTSVPSQGRNSADQQLNLQSFVVEIGLDEATLKSYPTLLYSEAKLHKTDSTSTCCSICLADYKSTDKLRLLPDCGHLFHLKCVDPWLRLHPTCPVCRTSPLPTPLATPLAEVVPLASRRDWPIQGRKNYVSQSSDTIWTPQNHVILLDQLQLLIHKALSRNVICPIFLCFFSFETNFMPHNWLKYMQMRFRDRKSVV